METQVEYEIERVEILEINLLGEWSLCRFVSLIGSQRVTGFEQGRIGSVGGG